MGVAGRPAGTVAGRVAGRLPTGAPVGTAGPAVPRQAVPGPAAAGRPTPRHGGPSSLVIDLTATPPTATGPAPGLARRAPAPGAQRAAALAVLLVGVVAAACALLVDLGTGSRALAGLVALWGVVVGGFALVRPGGQSGRSATTG